MYNSIAMACSAIAAIQTFELETTVGSELVGSPSLLNALTFRDVLRHRSGLNDYFVWPDHRHAVEARESPWAEARILLNKEHVFNQMGDIKGALAVLEEADPIVEAVRDPNLLFALRVDVLCRLEKWRKAARLLPWVSEMAVERGNELELYRTVWLRAKLAGGQGQLEAAISGLEHVSQAFTAHELPYEAALSSLDLAVLWLKAGRIGDVA